jgi:hypothetical protein
MITQLIEITNCFTECDMQPGASPVMVCANDTLAVTWPTDLTFDGTVTEIPADHLERFTERLKEESEHPILDVVVISNVPP